MSVTLFDLVGRSVEFRYPRHNLAVEGVPKRTESRHIRVDRVRDVQSEPLDPMTLALSPLQRRGRYLITGYDDDRGAERSFYFESMQDVRVIDSPQRGGLSEPEWEAFDEGHRAGLCDAANNQRSSAGLVETREPFANISVSSGVFLHGGEMEGRSMDMATLDERFPPLELIVRNGEKSESVEFPDPRKSFAEVYEGAKPTARCHPVCSAINRASDKRDEE